MSRPAPPVLVKPPDLAGQRMCLIDGTLLEHRIWLDAYHAADEDNPTWRVRYADECLKHFEKRFPDALRFRRPEISLRDAEDEK